MPAYRKLMPTVHLPSRDAAAARRALKIWLATGTVPVAHIVEDPEMEITDDVGVGEPIAA